MKLLSVNVSPVKNVSYQGKTVATGIFKEPLADRVMVRRLNIDGDDQGDRRVHGGFDMAIYAYPIEHYAYWQEQLRRDSFPHGQFGENLTVQGMSEDQIRVGDVYLVGSALLQVTQPRIPCYKLAMRMGEGLDFPARFQKSGRPGFYLRVLEEGEICAGDAIHLIDRDEDSVTIAEFIRVYLYDAHDPESLKRVRGSRDLGEAWRLYLESMLKKAVPVIQAAGWEGFRPFVVDRKVPESANITSFYLRPKDGAPLPAYLPGQFLTFRLNISGESHPVTRTYTLSDSPRPDYYRVSIKREPARRQDLPPGRSSNYFHDQVKPGSELCVKAPSGQFTLDPGDNSPLVLLSAGVGLTPMVSMLNAIVEADSQRPVWFIHGARNGREHAMGVHVRHLAAKHNNVHAHITYSRPNTEDVAGRDYHGTPLVELQADELRTFSPCKAKPTWVFTSMEVCLRLWSSTVFGRRSYANTEALFSDTLLRGKIVGTPLIMMDGFEFYERVIRRLLGVACIYAQVIKTWRKDRIIRVGRRAIIGTTRRLEKALDESEDSAHANTAYIERLNLTIRHGRLFASTQSHPCAL
ncbi:MAG: MOSC domain-containing protein [Thiogranum sp.]